MLRAYEESNFGKTLTKNKSFRMVSVIKCYLYNNTKINEDLLNNVIKTLNILELYKRTFIN